MFGQEAAAFFLVKEENGFIRKPFSPGRDDGFCSVFSTQGFGGYFGFFNFGIEPPISEHEEAEADVTQDLAFADPGV